MNNKKSILLLLISHIMAVLIGGAVGAYLYRSLTTEDESYLAAVAENEKERATRDDALEKSVRDDAGEPLTGVSTFAVQGHGMSNVTFTSDAPLERIVGNTSVTSGNLTVDLGDITQTTGSISVDISTLKTGIDSRDEHLQAEKWLHTSAYPNATFTLEKVQSDGKSMMAGRAKKATLEGIMEIKGTKRPATMTVTINYYPWSQELEEVGVSGDVLRINGNFEVKLSEFGVDTPSGISGKKIAENVRIDLSLAAITDGPSTQ